MKKKILALALFLTLMALFSGCAKGARNNSNSRQSLNKAKEEKPVPVMVEKLQTADLEEYISFTAKLEGITDIFLTSESSGKVVEINKKLGDWVTKGEAIGRIDNDSYLNQQSQAEAALLAAEASLELAEMQYETSKKLFESENISRSEYINAQSSFKQAQAGYESAKATVSQAELAVKNSRFTAPVSGYISDLTLEIGAYIGMGQHVCRIVDNSRLMIKTGLNDLDIKGMEVGQEVYVKYNGLNQEITGKITGIGIAPAAGSVNYPVEIELSNPGNNLLPGMVVSGRILRATYKNVLFTSINNIIKVYDDYQVYVINAENRSEQRKINLGKQVERSVIIESGLLPGDLLVTEGANSLSDGSLVEIKN